jgi:UDP-N-acetylmuramate dehydrogenase
MFLLSDQTKRSLMRSVKGTILFDELMKNHTTFRIGGPADALVIPKNEIDLKNLLYIVNKNNLALTVIGNGTKILVGDEGINGATVKVSGCLNAVVVTETIVKAGAGCSLANLSLFVADFGLSGLEFAVGIPGTVGGGVFMNAGAHGSMISDVVTSVTTLCPSGQLKRYSKNALEFGYRQSMFQKSEEIVLRAELSLKRDKKDEIKDKMLEYKDWRRKKQPLNVPNAGSIFKNPAHTSAGKLIDEVGLGGLKIGDAKISEEHANFIINLGNAAASDVLELMNIAEMKVFREYGVRLVPEIRLIGRFKHGYQQ